jgi:NAD(P)H-hydrate epimerase
VQPILTTAQMRDADARAVAARGQDALVAAAGTAVALEARALLGSCYGRRVAVVVGPGLNGTDGRVCARWLAARGAKVEVIDVATQPERLEGYDLVVDAAFGLGCSRPYLAPGVAPATPVLAVDLPSGVDADSGELLGEPMAADVTVALGALKGAHVTGPAARLAGEVRLRTLGIVGEASAGAVEDADLADLVITARDDHKWSHALTVIAGSPLMPGAAVLVARGALAAGASMIRLSTNGSDAVAGAPPEVVHQRGVEVDPRCRCVVAGPGLGVEFAVGLAARLAALSVPVVLDADALQREVLEARPSSATWLITPHDGEYARLTGRPVPPNRLAAARQLAGHTGCVVLLKGPVTVVAAPSGEVRVVRSGTASLATAGTGDVLAGMIGATVARGVDLLNAAALAAHLHGRAGARLDPYEGASDVPGRVTEILHELIASRAAGSGRG